MIFCIYDVKTMSFWLLTNIINISHLAVAGKRREFTVDTILAVLDYLKCCSVQNTSKWSKVDAEQAEN